MPGKNFTCWWSWKDLLEVIGFQGFLKPGISLRALLARGHANYDYILSASSEAKDLLKGFTPLSFTWPNVLRIMKVLEGQEKEANHVHLGNLHMCHRWYSFSEAVEVLEKQQKDISKPLSSTETPLLQSLTGPYCHEWEAPDALSPSPPCTWSTKSSVHPGRGSDTILIGPGSIWTFNPRTSAGDLSPPISISRESFHTERLLLNPRILQLKHLAWTPPWVHRWLPIHLCLERLLQYPPPVLKELSLQASRQ